MSFNNYNYCSTSSVGIASDGVVIYPLLNSNLHVATETGTVSSTGIESGSDMKLRYRADSQGANNNGLNLYNFSDYSDNIKKSIWFIWY